MELAALERATAGSDPQGQSSCKAGFGSRSGRRAADASRVRGFRRNPQPGPDYGVFNETHPVAVLSIHLVLRTGPKASEEHLLPRLQKASGQSAPAP